MIADALAGYWWFISSRVILPSSINVWKHCLKMSILYLNYYYKNIYKCQNLINIEMKKRGFLILGFILGYLIFDEVPGLFIYIGCALILISATFIIKETKNNKL